MGRKKKYQTVPEYVDECIKGIRCFFYDSQLSVFDKKKRLKNENNNYSFMAYTFHETEALVKQEAQKKIDSSIMAVLNGKNKIQ